MLRGEAGIGKTALLDHAAAAAGDPRVLRCVGVEAEAELVFAALHQMLYAHLDRIDTLPAAQAAALHAAFGTGRTEPSNRFQIGAATPAMLRGEVVEARSGLAEGVALAEELGFRTETVVLRSLAVWVAAASGDDACHTLARDVLPEADARTPVNVAIARWGLGVHALSAGHPGDALRVLGEACAGPALRDVVVRAVPDHVEAAVRFGDPDAARRYPPELDRWAEQVGSPVARGLALRCHALLAGEGAEELFRSASKLQSRYDLARTRLAYGEWLRRRRRRTDAHTPSSTPHWRRCWRPSRAG